MISSDNFNVSSTDEETPLDLRQYIDLFRQWWWLILLSAVLAAAAAYLVSRQITPLYQASTTLYINGSASNKTADYNSILASERLARTYTQMIDKRPVLTEVISRLSLPLTTAQLANIITADLVRDTQLIVITVESADPNQAAAIANTLYAVFSEQVAQTQASRFAASKESLQAQILGIEMQIADARFDRENAGSKAENERIEARINQLEQIHANIIIRYEEVRVAEAQTTSTIALAELAYPPSRPIKPNILQNTLLAAVTGLLLAAGGIFAFDALDDTIKDPQTITRRFNLPILGVIGRCREQEADEGFLVTCAQPRSPITEAFRALRTNVQYASVDQPIRTLLITSPAPADGKSNVAANLSVVLAQSGRRVTLIDADLRRPRQHAIFAPKTQTGLTTLIGHTGPTGLTSLTGLTGLFLRPKSPLSDSLQPTHQEDLSLIPAGELPPNPSELLGSQKMREILTAAAQTGFVVIDTPPILTVTDAAVLAAHVDAVILVLRPDQTKMSALKAAIEQLRRVNANLTGVVINNVNSGRSRYGSYYRSYTYHTYEHRPTPRPNIFRAPAREKVKEQE